MNGTFRDDVLIKRMEKDLGKKIFRTLVKMHFAEFQEIASRRHLSKVVHLASVLRLTAGIQERRSTVGRMMVG